MRNEKDEPNEWDLAWEARIRKILNLISLVFMLISAIFLVSNFAQKNTIMVASNAVVVLFMAGVVFLNGNGKFKLARWAIILFLNGLLTLFSFLVGRQSGMHIPFFCLICVPMVLFAPSERISIAVGSSISFISYLVLDWYALDLSPQSIPAVSPYSSKFEAVATFILLFLMINRLIQMMDLSETRLKKALESLKSNQQALVQAANQAALGQMAGGVAHEVNNPLAILKGRLHHTQRLMQRGEAEEGLDMAHFKELIPKLLATVDRIAVIVQSLLFIARDESSDSLEGIRLNDIIDSLVLIRPLAHQV